MAMNNKGDSNTVFHIDYHMDLLPSFISILKDFSCGHWVGGKCVFLHRKGVFRKGCFTFCVGILHEKILLIENSSENVPLVQKFAQLISQAEE